MRMRKKPNLSIRMERCAGMLVSDPAAMRGRWRELFPAAREVRLEIGCGKGRFSAETAEQNPDVLYIALERVPDAMIVAMERCQAKGLTNIFFIDGDAALLRDYFAPGEVDLLYINFCDPWPGVKHARRRLTHEQFLVLYRGILGDGGQIHFKSDNHDLFEWSLFQFPKAGYTLSEVTRDLHREGIRGVMTDYEEKFHLLGTPINRCVGTMVPWEEPFPTTFRAVKNQWLDAFADGVSQEDLGKHVLSEGNYLWHIFSWKLTPCLEGDAARKALAALPAGKVYLFYEGKWNDLPYVKPVELPLPGDFFDSLHDVYLVDKDFTWTYVHTHEAACGPYFCRSEQEDHLMD